MFEAPALKGRLSVETVENGHICCPVRTYVAPMRHSSRLIPRPGPTPNPEFWAPAIREGGSKLYQGTVIIEYTALVCVLRGLPAGDAACCAWLYNLLIQDCRYSEDELFWLPYPETGFEEVIAGCSGFGFWVSCFPSFD